MINLCLIIGIILVCVVFSYMLIQKNKESFVSHVPDFGASDEDEDEDKEPDNPYDRAPSPKPRKKCRHNNLPMDFDINDYVRKTHIPACPSVDLKDYVLKSTIPPIQKCPSCICPKVKVSAGMCKKCPEPKNNCPKPQPCGIEQCKEVIKCEPHQKKVACPICPAPRPCPIPPKRLCPSLTIEKPRIKCPAPKPCPMPEKCRDGKGRCPPKKSPKCSFKGIETVIKEKSVEEMVDTLLTSEDPKLKELLIQLKGRLNMNESVSPADLNKLRNEINSLKGMLVETNEEDFDDEDGSVELESEHKKDVSPAPTTSSLMNLDNTYLSVNKDFVSVNNNNACKNGNCPYDTNLDI